MQADSQRGSPLEPYGQFKADDFCQCSHKWAHHRKLVVMGRAVTECTMCPCQEFIVSMNLADLYGATPRRQSEDERLTMANAAQKAAEQNGTELARKYAGVFVIRAEATYEAKVELGMYFAGREQLTLENGAAFVTGFVNGLGNGGKRSTRSLSLEEKIDILLEREVDNRLGSGDDDSGSAGTSAPTPE